MTHAATIEHPSLVALPHGAMGILFGRGRDKQADIVLADLPAGARHANWTRVLVRSPDYAAFPRGMVDSSGTLDVLYMERCCEQEDWDVRLGRFSLTGKRIASPKRLTEITSLASYGQAAPMPYTWGLALALGLDGSIWAASLGDSVLVVGHWAVDGRMLLDPQQLVCPRFLCNGAHSDSLGLAVTRRHRLVFFLAERGLGVHPYAADVRDDGTVRDVERVSYDYGGGASDIRAGTERAGAVVLWQKQFYSGSALLEGTSYRAARSPDLATRLGVSLGPLWANVLIVLGGSLVGAIPIVVANVFLLAGLLLVWLGGVACADWHRPLGCLRRCRRACPGLDIGPSPARAWPRLPASLLGRAVRLAGHRRYNVHRSLDRSPVAAQARNLAPRHGHRPGRGVRSSGAQRPRESGGGGRTGLRNNR